MAACHQLLPRTSHWMRAPAAACAAAARCHHPLSLLGERPCACRTFAAGHTASPSPPPMRRAAAPSERSARYPGTNCHHDTGHLTFNGTGTATIDGTMGHKHLLQLQSATGRYLGYGTVPVKI